MEDKRPRKTRRPSFCRTEYSEGTKSLPVIQSIGSSNKPKRIGKESIWKPREAFALDGDKRQYSNVLDKKSLYSIRREHIAGRELSFLSRPPSGQHESSSLNIEHLVEKNYIIDSQLASATQEKFPKVIMRHFHRMSGTDKELMFGMPRPPTRETNPLKKLMEDMRREPSIVRIDQYPSLQEPIQCTETDEFCEILGPSSCQKCIECTNRRIGEELQQMVFPTIDITPDKLIYPKMAQVLTDGHRLQIRKRRMREIGVEMPFDLINFPRQKSHLSSSTCLTCKKPIVHIAHIEIPPVSSKGVSKQSDRPGADRAIQTARI